MKSYLQFFSIFLTLLFPVASMAGGGIYQLRTTNNTADFFTVSWLSVTPETGWVAWGTSTSLGNIAYDERGSSLIEQTHYVDIGDHDEGEFLNSATTYYYVVISGGVTYDHSGTPFTTETGPYMTGIPPPIGLYGSLYDDYPQCTNGAVGAIVYLTVQDSDGLGDPGLSQTLATYIKVSESPYYNFPVGSIRRLDLSDYFHFSEGGGDTVIIEAFGPGVSSYHSEVTGSGPLWQMTDLCMEPVSTTPTVVATETPTGAATLTPTPTLAVTLTPTSTAPSDTPTQTPTPPATVSPTATAVVTMTPTMPIETPTPTATPIATASPTPTVATRILLAGYWDSSVTTQAGGSVQIIALSEQTDEVEIYSMGQPTGATLPPYDQPNGVFWMQAVSVPSGLPPQRVLFELLPRNSLGEGNLWPYLTVES